MKSRKVWLTCKNILLEGNEFTKTREHGWSCWITSAISMFVSVRAPLCMQIAAVVPNWTNTTPKERSLHRERKRNWFLRRLALHCQWFVVPVWSKNMPTELKIEPKKNSKDKGEAHLVPLSANFKTWFQKTGQCIGWQQCPYIIDSLRFCLQLICTQFNISKERCCPNNCREQEANHCSRVSRVNKPRRGWVCSLRGSCLQIFTLDSKLSQETNRDQRRQGFDLAEVKSFLSCVGWWLPFSCWDFSFPNNLLLRIKLPSQRDHKIGE